MTNRIGKGLGVAAWVATTALSGGAMAADLAIGLDGAGSSTGAPLSAVISIDITGPKTATLHVTNTSPESAPSLMDAPVLTRIGFNLAAGPAASCLSVASPANWSLSGKVGPYCGVGGTSEGSCSKSGKDGDDHHGKGGKDDDYGKSGKGGDDHHGKGGKGDDDDDHGKSGKGGSDDDHGKGGDDDDYTGSGKSFTYELRADNPMPSNGIARGETLDIELEIKSCCGAFSLSADSFLDAGLSPSGGELVQVAAKFQVVGPQGQDSGCARGDVNVVEPPPPPPRVTCQPTYTWSEFIATAAESSPWPSDVALLDTRAGSVEYNFNGGWGFIDTVTDSPFDAAILTLRNGLSSVLEQTQFNRRWADAMGCQTANTFVRCWIFAPMDLIDQALAAVVPTWSSGSNSGHDSSGARVEISGELVIDYRDSDMHSDNAHEMMTVTWYAPKGLASAQLLLRGRYDWNLDGLNSSDPMVPLFRRNVTGYGDMQDPGVVVLKETATTLTIALNAQAGLVRVCEAYADAAFINVDGSPSGYATVGGPSGYATVN